MKEQDLPRAPKRVLIGHEAHAAMAAALRSARPDLEIRDKVAADITVDDVAWAEAYLGFRQPHTPTLGNINWVHSTGAGVDPWLFPHELSSSILLTRSSESFGPMIAEWTLSRALAITQHVLEFAESQRTTQWKKREPELMRGTNAVVVGTGDVGAHVAALFRAVGCNVHGVSRSGRGDGAIFHQLSKVSELATVVRDAAWLVLMLPLTSETQHLVNREVLSQCRNAILINAGRGPVVDESVLPEALEKGWLRGAALDVFEVEPLPATSPLWGDPRVIVSPHISGITTVPGAVNGFLECLGDLEKSQVPKWVVERDRQY